MTRDGNAIYINSSKFCDEIWQRRYYLTSGFLRRAPANNRDPLNGINLSFRGSLVDPFPRRKTLKIVGGGPPWTSRAYTYAKLRLVEDEIIKGKKSWDGELKKITAKG